MSADQMRTRVAIGLRWGTENLDHWLDNPGEFLPGNKMTFAGVHDADDRPDLIAYIATQTRTPPAA